MTLFYSLTSRDLVTESQECVFGRCVTPPAIQSCWRIRGHHEAKGGKAWGDILWFAEQPVAYSSMAVMYTAGGYLERFVNCRDWGLWWSGKCDSVLEPRKKKRG